MIAAPTPAMDFGRASYEKDGAMKKTLVAYASRYGSTAEVARAVAERLSQRGEAVEMLPVEEVKDLSPYKAVVLGSAVRVGKWLPAAAKFAEQHGEELRRLPTAIFSVHFLAVDDSEESRQKRATYTEPVKKLFTPRHEAFFPGKIDPSQMGFGDKLATRLVGAPTGDLRNWQAIQAWADSIPQA